MTSQTIRLLRTYSARRKGRDPGPGALSRLIGLLEESGLPVAKRAKDRAAAAAQTAREAAAAGRDTSRTPQDRSFAADRLRSQASRERGEAAGAFDGKAIEAAGRKRVHELTEQVTAALARLPEGVTTGEAALAAGPDVAAAWAEITVADQTAATIWTALDECRRLGVLPTSLRRGDFNPVTSDLPNVLLGPGTHDGGGYYVPAAHRAAHPQKITPSTTLSEMLRRDAGPGVYNAAEARAHIEAYAADVLNQNR